jgi:hypothetical protein
MKPAPPPAEPEIPAELSLPPVLAHEVPGLSAVAPGQLVELADGEQLLVMSVSVNASQGGAHATALRVGWPRHGALPLGELVALEEPSARLQGPLRVVGAWYAPAAVPRPERVVLEAIRRGFITARTCGVPWPLAPTWQLSPQAAEQIEKYLFQVARSTGTAFPFHDITRAMQRMHLQVSLDNPGQCDIVAGESPGRHPSSDEEMLAVWARELQRRVHSSELVLRGDERTGPPPAEREAAPPGASQSAPPVASQSAPAATPPVA